VDETRTRAGTTLRRRAGWPAGLAVSSGPVGEPAKPADDPVDITKILQATKARDHQIFTGKLVKKHLSFPDRAVVSAIRAQEGDFRNWAQITDWATGIADALLS
jgi:menaquinone-dependent protoporphyrinogen oxidase